MAIEKPVSSSFSGYEIAFGLATQESPAQLKSKNSKLFIGIPKEKFFRSSASRSHPNR